MNIGEQAALLAALMWTVSSMFWGQLRISALGINLCKNWIGAGLLLIHLLVVSIWFGQPAFSADATAWSWLSLSGLIGLVIGDTLYFRSLQIVGPRLALIMASMGPIFAAMLGWVFLQQQLGYFVITGVLLTVAGVITVVADRKAKDEAPGLLPGNSLTAVLCGVGGAICQAAGGMFSAIGMENCSALESSFIRLFFAAIITLVVVVFQKQLTEILKEAFRKKTLQIIVPAATIGTWLGIWLSQIAYKHSDLAIAQTLMGTCPLFAIPIVWYFHGHRVTTLSIFGTIIALVGVYFTVQ